MNFQIVVTLVPHCFPLYLNFRSAYIFVFIWAKSYTQFYRKDIALINTSSRKSFSSYTSLNCIIILLMILLKWFSKKSSLDNCSKTHLNQNMEQRRKPGMSFQKTPARSYQDGMKKTSGQLRKKSINLI